MSVVDLQCDEYQNQYLLFLQIISTQIFLNSVTYFLITLHYVLLPLEMLYFGCIHVVQQLMMITKM